jgi:hypothetical protein
LNEIAGFASMSLPFQGVLRISSASPISAVGLRGRYNERNEFLVTTTPPVSEVNAPTDSPLFFPHFAEAGGFSTQFVLFNATPGTTPSGSLRLVSQGGLSMILPLK